MLTLLLQVVGITFTALILSELLNVSEILCEVLCKSLRVVILSWLVLLLFFSPWCEWRWPSRSTNGNGWWQSRSCFRSLRTYSASCCCAQHSVSPTFHITGFNLILLSIVTALPQMTWWLPFVDVTFIFTSNFAWKCAVITLISCLPPAVAKWVHR